MNKTTSTTPISIALSLILSLACTGTIARAQDADQNAYKHADKPKNSRKPNIIFIMADDLGYGDLGSYGQKQIKTPHLDKMAAQGMRFETCYAGSPVCGPARDCLMTGRHSGHATRRDNRAKANQPGEGKDRGLVPLKSTDRTIASMLKEAGYATGGYGKWGLGNPGTTGTPDKHGFDEWFGYIDQVHAHSYYPDHLVRDGGERVPLPGNENGKRETYTADVIHEASLEFIRKHHDQPFFVYLAYTLPHGKFEVPSLGPYESEDWPTQQKTYAAMVTHMDRHIGEVFALLRELKVDDNTIVFFTADHGPVPQFKSRFNGSLGQRGHKRQLFEGGVRVPMIVRWPGKIKPNSYSEYIWWHVDFLETASDLAGLQAKPNGPSDGVSVLPTLLGQTQPPREHFYWEFYSPFQQSVRMRQWKGIRFGTEDPLMLFDLSKDLNEKNNIASKHPAIVKKIEQVMKQSHIETPYWPLKATAKGQGKQNKQGKQGNNKKGKK